MTPLYWYGPLEIQSDKWPGVERRPGLWVQDRSGIFRPHPAAYACMFGGYAVGAQRRFLTSTDACISFVPRYFSYKVLAFLLGVGACIDGAYCWASLPPEFLVWEIMYPCRDARIYPHEHKFFMALKRKWPSQFSPMFITDLRPSLSLLEHPAAEWGL